MNARAGRKTTAIAKPGCAEKPLNYNEMRKARTVDLVAAAIKRLKQDKRAVSLSAIREMVMATEGYRLSESTIMRNDGASRLYEAAAGKKKTDRVARMTWLLQGVSEEDQPVARRVISALRRKSKSELVLLAWGHGRRIEKLEAELKAVRAEKLDAAVPANVKVLRGMSQR